MEKKKIVFITGAGISQESGIPTYRDKGGLWEKYNPEIYCSAYYWDVEQDELNDFYNLRRSELKDVKYNSAHSDIVKLEELYDVQVITQNVDDLHERAGSTNILHLHGELTKIRLDRNKEQELDSSTWIDIKYDELDLSERPGYRPAIVFFGDNVPKMDAAKKIVSEADILVVVGTSLVVYPAASLVESFEGESVYLIDPYASEMGSDIQLKSHAVIEKKATEGMKELLELLDLSKKG